MITVGLIGMGGMGRVHCDVYRGRGDVRIAGVCDIEPARLQVAGLDGARRTADAMELIRDPEIQLIDICTPTPLHYEHASAALEAGKHVLVEKPLARTAQQAHQLAAFAQKSKGLAMCGMCMRFWPGWTRLKTAIDRSTYGRILSLSLRRLGSAPAANWYRDGRLSGGAALDLHIHDADFVQYCFGIPRAVLSRGYARVSGEIDHLVTHYMVDMVPLVVAEASWTVSPSVGFRMQYTAIFEHATAIYDLGAAHPLMLHEEGVPAVAVELPSGSAYEQEIAYLLECVRTGERPERVTLTDAANAVAIVEAEIASIRQRRAVELAGE